MEATCEEDDKEIQNQIKKHMNKYRKEGILYIILNNRRKKYHNKI